MKKDDFLKHIKVGKSLLIIGIVILLLGAVSNIFYYLSYTKEEATLMFDVQEQDKYATIKVEAMSSYFASESTSGKEKRYYLVYDNNYAYMACLDPETYDKLKAIYDYSMLEDVEGVEVPEAVAIYGKSKVIQDWQIKYLQDWLKDDEGNTYSKDELYSALGYYYIDTYDVFENEMVTIGISSISCLIISMIFIIMYFVRNNKYKKIMAEHGEDIEHIAMEIENGNAIHNKICKCYLTDRFIISYQSGLKMIDCKEVVWIYPFEYRQRGVVTQKSIYVITKNGKTNVIATTSAWGKKNKIAYEEFYQEIMNKLPDVLYGYTKENKEKAKEMYTKKK